MQTRGAERERGCIPKEKHHRYGSVGDKEVMFGYPKWRLDDCLCTGRLNDL